MAQQIGFTDKPSSLTRSETCFLEITLLSITWDTCLTAVGGPLGSRQNIILEAQGSEKLVPDLDHMKWRLI